MTAIPSYGGMHGAPVGMQPDGCARGLMRV
jgi:hypothetical protein